MFIMVLIGYLKIRDPKIPRCSIVGNDEVNYIWMIGYHVAIKNNKYVVYVITLKQVKEVGRVSVDRGPGESRMLRSAQTGGDSQL